MHTFTVSVYYFRILCKYNVTSLLIDRSWYSRHAFIFIREIGLSSA